METVSLYSGRTPSEIIEELDKGKTLCIRQDDCQLVIRFFDINCYLSFCIDPELKFAEQFAYGLRLLTKEELIAEMGFDDPDILPTI